jgi:hypothetical protein
MDADDICYPFRFEKQVEFLKAHPKHIVCGTWIEQIDENGASITAKEQCRNIPKREEYRIYLLFGNYPNIVHPTAMFNRSLLIKNQIKYDEHYPVAQDYCMWVQCSKYAECANLSEILLKYRVHGTAVSNAKRELQAQCVLDNIRGQLKEIGLELPKEYETIHKDFILKRHKYDIGIREWIVKLILANRENKVFQQKQLECVLWKKWAEIIYYELRNRKNMAERIKLLQTLPIKYTYEIIKIFLKRKRKFKDRR